MTDPHFARRAVAALAGLTLAQSALPADAGLRVNDAPRVWRTSVAGARAAGSLPVYGVISAGATPQQAAILARDLKLPPAPVLRSGGLLSFTDSARYLALPTTAASSPVIAKAVAATSNKYPKIPIGTTIVDTSAIGRQAVPSDAAALTTALGALKDAGLEPQFGTPLIGHDEVSLYSADGRSNLIAPNHPIDTQVNFRFNDPNGIPFIGPGAQVGVTFDAAGVTSRLTYAARRLRPIGNVALISKDEALTRITRLLPAKAAISARLVYYAPPLGGTGKTRPAAILPWYAYYGTTRIVNPQTGGVSLVRSHVGLIPATDDKRFVPVAALAASGGSQVRAAVSVAGGTPPYRYVWGGSDPAASRLGGATVSYTPVLRSAPSLVSNPAFNLQRTETISVTVIDANGLTVSASEIVSVVAHALYPHAHDSAAPSYGCESPDDPGQWTPARVAWEAEMGRAGAGGGSESFCWLGDDAWPGDFIRPTPAATLVATPWVYGDADFANWGVDTADLVLDNADGNPDLTVQMQPGAPLADYSTSYIGTQALTPDVGINQDYGVPANVQVGYPGAWGPVGPNDTLEWLLLDDCDMLDATDGHGFNVAQRWGPAFGGLHVLTGFASLATGNGPFEGGVADDVLGVYGPPQSIVQAWFGSAAATGAGTAAAMGPALATTPGGPFWDLDFNDHYWGKGSVGATITPASYPSADIAWWYLTTTTPPSLVFP